MSDNLPSYNSELTKKPEASPQFLETLNDFSKKYPIMEPEKMVYSINTNSNENEIIEFNQEIKDNFLPYPSQDEIPTIKIRDENSIFSGKEIKQIKFYKYYPDEKYSKCRQCKSRNIIADNSFYCKECNENKCENCSKSCIKHTLINLREEKNNVEKLIIEIENFLTNNYFNPKEKNAAPNEKDNRKYFDQSFSNVDVYNSFQNSFSYSNDIILIRSFIYKNYNNYFHYQNIKQCHNYIYYIYNNDCLKIEYKYNMNEFIGGEFKLFGNFFVKNNKDNILLRINGETTELVEKMIIEHEFLEVIIIQKKDNEKKNLINNMSCMFCDCKANEIAFSEVKKGNPLDLSQVTDISKMFKNCSNLQKINLIFLENALKITHMDYLFSDCKKLKNINNIGSLNTTSVINMNNMFEGCKEIEYLNGLENFKTDKVEYLKAMFKNCEKLEEVPDISKWNVKNVKSMKGMFKNCEKLEGLPDISKWDVKNVKSMKGMFKNCKALKQLPDVSNWNVENVVCMEEMFFGCENMEPPDLKKWKLTNLDSINKIFFGCQNIKFMYKLLYKKKFEISELLNINNKDNLSCQNVIDN